MANGWQTFGAVLGGGKRMAGNAYNTGVVQGAQGADLLEQAAERRNKNVNMAALTADLVQRAQAGDPQAQSQLISTSAQAGIDPRQFTGAQGEEQKIGWGNTAMAQAMQPNADLNSINRQLMVMGGKPVDLSTVQGNTLINQMVTPDQQAAQGGNVPTALGQAMIGTQGAEAGADNARAAASYASAKRQLAGIGADKAANYETVTGKDGNLWRVNKLDPSDAEPITQEDGTPMAAALNGRGIGSTDKVAPSTYESTFGKPSIAGGPNAKMQQFQAYRGIHPEMSESQALQNFEMADQNSPKNIPNPIPVTVPASGSMGAVVAPAPSAAPAPATVVAPVQPAAAPSGPAMPKSQADFDSLPSGSQFINPANGQLMVKK